MMNHKKKIGETLLDRVNKASNVLNESIYSFSKVSSSEFKVNVFDYLPPDPLGILNKNQGTKMVKNDYIPLTKEQQEKAMDEYKKVTDEKWNKFKAIDAFNKKLSNYIAEIYKFKNDRAYMKNARLSIEEHVYNERSKVEDLSTLSVSEKEDKIEEIYKRYRHGGAKETIFKRHFGNMNLDDEIKQEIIGMEGSETYTHSGKNKISEIKNMFHYRQFPRKDLDETLNTYSQTLFYAPKSNSSDEAVKKWVFSLIMLYWIKSLHTGGIRNDQWGSANSVINIANKYKKAQEDEYYDIAA